MSADTIDGPNVAAVAVDDAGAFTVEYDDGTHGTPTESLEAMIAAFHRARAIAVHSFLNKGRRPWPTPRI